MEKKKKKASEFFNQKKKKNQVSILQWVWSTQFCSFSLLLNTAFICSPCLTQASKWLENQEFASWFCLLITGHVTPDCRHCQYPSLALGSFSGMRWDALNSPEEQPPRGHLTWVCPCTGIWGAPGESCRMEVSSAANSPSDGTTDSAVESMAMKKYMLEGVNKEYFFSKLCSDIFFSAVQALS